MPQTKTIKHAPGGSTTKKNLQWGIDEKNGGALLVWGVKKPSATIREKLSRLGFRWSPVNGFWWKASFTNAVLRDVKEITGKQQQSIYYGKR